MRFRPRQHDRLVTLVSSSFHPRGSVFYIPSASPAVTATLVAPHSRSCNRILLVRHLAWSEWTGGWCSNFGVVVDDWEVWSIAIGGV